MTNPTQKTTLYRYFDGAGQLLYVGITGDNTNRQSQHRRTSFWFGEIASATFEHFDSRAEADQAETLAIKNEKPLNNIAKTNTTSPGKITLHFSAKMHLVQMLSEPDNGHDDTHREWAKEVKSWLLPHDCFDLEWDEHLVLHLMKVEADYVDRKRPKLPNHLACDLCKEIFDTSWYVNTELPLTLEDWGKF